MPVPQTHSIVHR